MEEKDWNDDSLTMTTVSHHCFSDDSKAPSFSISIIENMKDEYGLFLWPCNVVLVEYVWQHNHRFSGANVVELGAGTSLLGLVAAKLGVCVTLTDDFTRLGVLHYYHPICSLHTFIKISNKLLLTTKHVLGLTWGVWDSSIFSLQSTIILGADVLYDSNGSGHHLIEFWVGKWGLECLKLLDGFSFLPSDKASL
ncbi:methyltransferase-like protein 23 isoform X2 [Glycine soja]|uniref:methyltransferase-like protein 23 isoform X2 n=1 Tax=Glycine max TaxID=3847 RepID=UPI0007193D5C|nr:methyltransferase-like protein 23 isoform X2 [Glycine max]XP_028184616.1 methyltransferase-like protein 23 isoform X2 [Glycine soja]|eukprot:XP_014628592.1 methyltransferase-like protein 23 isoform X2 [Glycine max]